MTMNAEQQYIELFSQTEAMICKHSAEVLNAPRAAAFADFERIGFPTRKMEKYKYTDVRGGQATSRIGEEVLRQTGGYFKRWCDRL